MNNIEPLFAALADGHRRRVLELLRRGPMRASDLATGAGIARNLMSRHLGVLRSSGLVTMKISPSDGRNRLYELQGERVAEVRDWLAAIESDWRDQLGRFRDFAEQQALNPNSGDD